MLTYKIPSKASVTFQVVIWSVLFVVFTILNKFAFVEPFTKTLPTSVFNMLMNIILVNIHLYVLIPSFFNKKTMHQYIFFLLITAVVLSLMKSLSIYWIKPEGIEEGFFVSKAPKIAFTTSVMVLILTLPLLLFDELIRKEVEKANIKARALETELQFLKMQVNPHFLFNVLNNIYAMIFTKSADAAPVVMKLSELMRFMLYDSNDQFILLDKEIKYVQDFIDLHVMKQRKNRTVEFLVNSIPDHIQIPPFLLIPLFENAFKHGNWDEEKKQGWIKSEISYENEQLIFHLSNSVSSPTKNTDKSGIGLKNVQQRLQLFYPNQHKLVLKQKEDRFNVHLSIQFS